VSRVPSRKEIKAVALAKANKMRAWISESRQAVAERNRLDQKAALLAGPSGGGSGITITMRQISGEAASRDPEYIHEHTDGGANRHERRHGLNRTRHDRQYEPAHLEGGHLVAARTIWPTPRSRNTTYTSPAEPERGNRA
jgi:hypothetical protein